MLLTLSAQSFREQLQDPKSGLTLIRLAEFARNELQFQGLCVQSSLLAGWDQAKLDVFRDAADKHGCPILLLIEDQPQPLGDVDPALAETAIQRLEKVVRVAHRLGCSGVALKLRDAGHAQFADLAASRLKTVVAKAERFEMNLLVAPGDSASSSPESLTSLIRKVGGFRIGSFPDFQVASTAADPAAYMRSLAPYASAITAAVVGFNAAGEHKGFDLRAMVESVANVGYEGNLMLEYRGKGDAEKTLLSAREAIEAIVQEQEQ